MHSHRIFLNTINSSNKYPLHNKFQKNKDNKQKDKIKEEILNLINVNMENIKPNLNNSKPSINNDNQLNSIDKENFINYNGENISIISNSISEINSV